MTTYVSWHKRATNGQSSNNVRKKVLWLLWKTVWSHPKKLEMELPHSLATLSRYVAKRIKRKDSGRFAHFVHSRIVSNWSAMKMNEEFICGWKDKTRWYIQEIEYFPDTFFKNIDESQRHYVANWSKSVTKWQTLCDSSYIRYLD